jgi:carbonic anhydrase
MSYALFLIPFLFIVVSPNQWNYGQLGPDIWSDYYPLCAGQSQSPINILTACTIYQEFPSFEFIAIDNEKHSMILNNNGNAIVGIMNEEWKQTPIRLTGGGLNGTFDFVNFHLHWGENYKSGSEHRM